MALKTKFASICSIRTCDETPTRWLIRSVTVDKRKLEAAIALCPEHLGNAQR